MDLTPSLGDLAVRLGIDPDALEPAERTRAEAATLAVAEVTPATAEAWVLKCPPIVPLVILKAARREFENPRGIEQETFADHSARLSDASGVYLTWRERSLIRRAAGHRGTRTVHFGTAH
ncbi:hypothetical protein [Agromyces archimandritae]|uniref:Uncharacterized protein n=1 Tax=Agromyces archimandritae TaxID=2781962 RepID=A0A975FL75_9MICO|nr:hypothetical protein [Agromyces archimandritae]QTX04545.1 hypothetical protein G127AT_14990 [Agromyces archimandritae]